MVGICQLFHLRSEKKTLCSVSYAMGAEKEAVIGGIREIAKRPGEVDKIKVDKILLAGCNGFKNDVLI